MEILLVLAFLTLLFQVFPSLWKFLWHVIDARQWSSTAWMVLNVGVLVALFGVRFGPDVVADIGKRRKRQASRRKDGAVVPASSSMDEDLEARRRRDAEWVQRAKKRLPWR